MNNDKQQLKILTQQIWNFIHSDECEDWSGEGGLIISAFDRGHGKSCAQLRRHWSGRSHSVVQGNVRRHPYQWLLQSLTTDDDKKGRLPSYICMC
jgi:hypothetical protein